MACKPFHESGIAISARMGASHIGINAVFHAGDAGFGEDRSDLDFIDGGLHKIILTV